MDHFLDEVKKMRAEDKLDGLPTTALAIGMMDRGVKKIKTKDGSVRDPTDFYSEGVVSVVSGSINKLTKPKYYDGKDFDIIILDDSHLIQTPSAFVPLSLLSLERGRLILAGDPLRKDDKSFSFSERTIPVTGLVTPEDCLRYSTPLLLTKPIFNCIFDNDDRRDRVLSVLNQNYSSNRELCSFLQDNIYVPCLFPATFEPRTEEIATASLLVTLPCPLPSKSDLPNRVFVPGKSLTVILFPTKKEITYEDGHHEIDVVLDLYKSLRNCTEMKRTAEATFWSEKFMIACANHSQKDSICRSLKALLGIPSSDNPPFCVNSLHGCSNAIRDVCLIDMAVFNTHKIHDEPWRFYNVGDLSLLLTRGRKKTIVLLSQDILTAWKPQFITGVEDWAKGLALFYNLVLYARDHDSLITLQ